MNGYTAPVEDDGHDHLMNPLAFLAVGLGAACGAWIRWWLGLRLNPLLLHLPLARSPPTLRAAT